MLSLCAFPPSLSPHSPPHTSLSKAINDIVFEVDCQLITVKDGDVDIGTYNPSDLSPLAHLCSGANPSAEEQDEGLEDGAKQVNNVAYSFRLQQVPFDKKSYTVHIKVHPSFFLPPSAHCSPTVGIYESSQGTLGKEPSREGQGI